ncbi:cytochrome P450 [Gandjariella thermophila]|uniref:Cytochrome P450 n=1 Tax=Gandjariella thermophila TaxID=1931992 RepID=A0A4D4JDH6_9PSEU|nr:cytochrome P450 [Gandjariella thermophila]GDY33070.1 cytochrome P450 [Gandjariella thermophila]
MDTTGIPHPPRRVPLLGDVRGVSPRTPVQDAIRLGHDLGPIFRRKFLRREIVFVTGAELVGELADESRFAKHVGLGVENLRMIGGDGLFTAYNWEPNWRRAHDILQPAFSLAAMRDYHQTMLDVARELIGCWDARVGGAPVDVAADMTRMTLETIGRTGFGYEFGSFQRDEPHPFVAAMVRVLRYAQQLNFRLPVIGRLREREAARQNAIDVESMNAVVDEVVAARRASGDTSTRDLLGLMLNQVHPDTGEALDPVNIRRQVITFLVAGHETTSGALSFALYYLANHPEVLARAQAEVDEMWGDVADPEPTFKEVTKLRYVRRVLDEALRLWPTAPGFSREAREDTVLGGRYPMRRGDWVIVLIPGLHRDPAVWGPDPDAFDPDRFAPGRARQRPAHAYKPFGTGERACIGRQFAVHEATLVLGLLLHRYHLRSDPAYRLRVAELLTLKPEGFALRLERRRPAAHPVGIGSPGWSTKALSSNTPHGSR